MTEESAGWREVYAGGSAEAEAKLIERLAQDMLGVQARIVRKTGVAGLRTLHAKILMGIENAQLIVDSQLAARFAQGYFRPGHSLTTTVRFSNASFFKLSDNAPDMRGAALRVHFADAGYHDLLMTSFPVSHARNAQQFVTIAKIVTGPKILILPRLLAALGPGEMSRVLENVRSGSRTIESLSVQQFWSRAPLLWGDAGPVRYTLRPTLKPRVETPDLADTDSLRDDFARRLRRDDITFRLALQPYVDERLTPVDDGATEWREADSPYIEVATLVIPRQDLEVPGAVAVRDSIDKSLAFNPWNCPPPFRPLGNLNRARRAVYAASAKGWLGRAAKTPHG